MEKSKEKKPGTVGNTTPFILLGGLICKHEALAHKTQAITIPYTQTCNFSAVKGKILDNLCWRSHPLHLIRNFS